MPRPGAPLPAFWSIPPSQLFPLLQTSAKGLSESAARERLIRQPSNLLVRGRASHAQAIFISQFTSPIILLLLASACLSYFLGSPIDALIILVIVFASGLLGFWQEFSAANAVAKLLSLVSIKADVLREGREREVPIEHIVDGDIVLLHTGDVIPGDGVLLEANGLFVDEATLTGESAPAEKRVGALPGDTPLSKRAGAVFLGTHVASGSGKMLVARTGMETEFGSIYQRLRSVPPETEFERGVHQFGNFLIQVTLLLVIAIFAINVYFMRPVADSFLFALALAVGLTPQLLPAVIAVTLAQGAKRMAEEKVVVKRLASIENFGSMNVLCCDKTGTLTEGTVRLSRALNSAGAADPEALRLAYLNASLQKGFHNPIDLALTALSPEGVSGFRRLGELPYDFYRKRLSVLVSSREGRERLLITKGAFESVLRKCVRARTTGRNSVPLPSVRSKLVRAFEDYSSQGFRVLAVAAKEWNSRSNGALTLDDESGLTFVGFLLFLDPPKPSVSRSLSELRQLGVSLKVITGDNRLSALALWKTIGEPSPRVLTGRQLREIHEEALVKLVGEVQVFAELEPNQKERIILALRKAGNVVGYLGDGINDASALHAADVGLSVNGAVDVAKEAADIVLLKKDLSVLARGVRMGRQTFANTLKYVYASTSANFGNMFTVAGSSLVLPFLPLLPKQILATNLLTDLPEMTIASDKVDAQLVDYPRRWHIDSIKEFMVLFGILSSLFDAATFVVLLWFLHASVSELRTGWFVESVISAAVIVLIIRTRLPFYKSLPSLPLLAATAFVAGLAVFLPFTPIGALLGFTPLPLVFFAAVALIVGSYVVLAEFCKHWYYSRKELKAAEASVIAVGDVR